MLSRDSLGVTSLMNAVTPKCCSAPRTNPKTPKGSLRCLNRAQPFPESPFPESHKYGVPQISCCDLVSSQSLDEPLHF